MRRLVPLAVMQRIAPRSRTCKRAISSRSTFTIRISMSRPSHHGVLDYGSGDVKGRQAIKEVIARMPKPAATPGLRAAAARHNISNIVIKVDGNKAAGRSYWFHYSNDNPERRGVFDGFGHYEDELVKTNGKWLFTKRKIYNEGRDEWACKGGKNPAW